MLGNGATERPERARKVPGNGQEMAKKGRGKGQEWAIERPVKNRAIMFSKVDGAMQVIYSHTSKYNTGSAEH